MTKASKAKPVTVTNIAPATALPDKFVAAAGDLKITKLEDRTDKPKGKRAKAAGPAEPRRYEEPPELTAEEEQLLDEVNAKVNADIKAAKAANPTAADNATLPATTPITTTPAEPAAPKPAGVTPTARTRTYLAGLIIKKYGLATGVTKEMVAELDAAYGEANPRESTFCLKNAYHAVRGYATNGNEDDLMPPK